MIDTENYKNNFTSKDKMEIIVNKDLNIEEEHFPSKKQLIEDRTSKKRMLVTENENLIIDSSHRVNKKFLPKISILLKKKF